MITVLAHGCFDLLHLGHIRHLQEAKSFGDRLCVSLTEDQYIMKRRGRTPYFSTAQRREALLALGCVDDVWINCSDTAVDAINYLKPNIYVKGVDYADADDLFLKAEIEAIQKVGGTFKLTTSEKWSSSKLLHAIRLPDNTLRYLDKCRKRGFINQILDGIAKADEKTICFVGEEIIDEYIYVKPLSRPSKELVLATVATNVERFEGGIIAASTHNDWKNRFRVVVPGFKITKRRYVDRETNRKLFEIYSNQEVENPGIPKRLLQQTSSADIVIVVDYGHGGLCYDNRRLLEEETKFLAVTAQSNAGNWGKNLITKYAKANYFCVDKQELELAGTMPPSKLATVTKGADGATSYNGTVDCTVPALVTGAIDTIGAGDTFLSVAAPLLAVGVGLEEATFAGNLAGGLKTLIVGQRAHVTRDDLVRNLQWLLG
jgi:rfaE bifunctional protein nucleotidyltransferase chain/domain